MADGGLLISVGWGGATTDGVAMERDGRALPRLREASAR